MDGYQVHPGELNALAERLDELAGELRAAEREFGGPQGHQPAAFGEFGEFGMAEACSGFEAGWATGLEAARRAVDGLAQKTAASSANYLAVEAAVSSSLASIGTGP
ncbi:type VII secretion target [Kitasatospora azatica]|uniref:type VII secretion target n=1 Tax=Kitasatospora azatica TaxID=58347 RepID=UPI00055F2018|nr:type VII secretion target [Kitasatospora azatica]